MTYLTSEWGLRPAIRQAASWYFEDVIRDPDAFIRWVDLNYGIGIALAPHYLENNPIPTYIWEVFWIEDEEKATLFKLQWS